MSTTVSPTPSLAGTRWTIDPSHTDVGFAVKHLMISTVKGSFQQVSGHAYVDTDQPSALDVLVEVDTASLHTRDTKRDAHLRSPDFFDVERFPKLTFRGKRIEGDLSRSFRLIGDLTIKDITREVALDVTSAGHAVSPWGTEAVGFTAATTVDRKDFGLTWNVALEAGGFLVADEVKIQIDVELVKSA